MFLLFPLTVPGRRFFPILLRLVKKKRLRVIGFRDWYGSVFLPMMPKPYLTDGHPDEIDLLEAQSFGKEMAEMRLRIETEGPASYPSAPEDSASPCDPA
jgi:hypothetical protein